MIKRFSEIAIHQQAIKHNLALVQKNAANSKVLSMVKANAYGHGVTAVLPALHTHTDGYGVCCLEEALEVQEWQSTHQPNSIKPICLIEGVFSEQEWDVVCEHDFMVMVHNQLQLDWVLSSQKRITNIWLKVNTGMNRLGFQPEQVIGVYKHLLDAGYDPIVSMHFANADVAAHPLNSVQKDRFTDVLTQLQLINSDVRISACNSAAIFTMPQLHGEWVRPGIMLYGANPLDADNQCKKYQHLQQNLKAVMQFTAKVFKTYTIKKGEYVGYGSTWQAQKDTKLAIVSIGYGDGYPRVVENAQVSINGTMYPLAGRVSMDMMAVDITDAIQGNEPQVGDTAELWGNKISISDVASQNGTIAYELMCNVGTRPKKIIIE